MDDLYYIHLQVTVGVANLVYNLIGEISSSSDESDCQTFEHYLTSNSQAMARTKRMRRGGQMGGDPGGQQPASLQQGGQQPRGEQ